MINEISYYDRTDTPLSITNINGTFYYHRDHQGSIIALTDSEGNIVEEITYDNVYGKVKTHSIKEENLTLNPYGYTGREMDAEDLYYYRARYYDPQTQRFLSKDPIEFEAGDFNFYRYVWNDPLNYVDPTGLYPSSGEMIDVGTAQEAADRALNNRADAMVDRRQRAIDANRGLPPLSKEEALERAKTQQENSDTMRDVVCTVAVGGVAGTGAKAAYGVAMRNPIQTFEFIDAALTALPTVKHMSTSSGQAGQALGWIIRSFR